MRRAIHRRNEAAEGAVGRDGWHLRRVEAGGFRGWYAAAGAGPPVVFLASPLARVTAYRPTVEELARRHRVHALELPGSGTADRLPRPWSPEEYAGWCAAALAALGVGPATVIGHSHAGGLAVVLGVLHPERVGRVVIADGVGACRRSFWRVLLGRFRDTLAVEFRLTAREWNVLACSLARHPRNFARQLRASLDADLTPYARRLAVPALVAWGGRDHTIPPRCGDEYARSLPQAWVYVSPGGSHCWPITHAAEFAAAVAGFVRQEQDGTASLPS